MTSHQALRMAKRQHQAGNLAEAEKLCRQILAEDPEDSDVLRLLGAVENQRGNFNAALDLIGRAVRIKPDNFNAHCEYARVLADRGRFDEAIVEYRKALELQWNDAKAHRDLGVALLATRRIDEAAASFERALQMDPKDAAAHNAIAGLRLKQKRFDDAIAASSKAIAIDHTFAEAHANLADALRGKGNKPQALEAYRRAVQLKPHLFQANINLGDLLRELGNLEDAGAAYEKAIEFLPGNPMPQFNLATAYHVAGRLEEALTAYGKAAAAKPEFLEAHVNMAIVLANLQRFDEALACQARAAALKPEAGVTHLAMGEIRLWQQETAAAVESFRRATAADPSLSMAWSQLGAALRAQGSFREADDCFRKMLELQPNSMAAYHSLVSTGKVKFTPDEINRLAAMLNQPNLTVPDRLSLGFALGKALDDLDRYDEAFAYYAKANALAKWSRAMAGEPYDPAAVHQMIDEKIRTYTPEFFRERRDWGDPSEIPVFVVGMPRSGTTLVQQIAASHPQVYGAGELRDIANLGKSLSPDDDSETARQWKAESIRQAAERHLRCLREKHATASRVVDKMPSNIVLLGFIAILFPRARVIHCLRDPRDTCLSCFFQLFSAGNPYSFDLAHCGHWHRELDRLAEHWRTVLPLRMIEMQYETMVSDFEGQSRRLIEFLGLPWDPACLEFHRLQNAVLTRSAWQVRQPIYSKSVGRWKHYEKHLGPLLKALGR